MEVEEILRPWGGQEEASCAILVLQGRWGLAGPSAPVLSAEEGQGRSCPVSGGTVGRDCRVHGLGNLVLNGKLMHCVAFPPI